MTDILRYLVNPTGFTVTHEATGAEGHIAIERSSHAAPRVVSAELDSIELVVANFDRDAICGPATRLPAFDIGSGQRYRVMNDGTVAAEIVVFDVAQTNQALAISLRGSRAVAIVQCGELFDSSELVTETLKALGEDSENIGERNGLILAFACAKTRGRKVLFANQLEAGVYSVTAI